MINKSSAISFLYILAVLAGCVVFPVQAAGNTVQAPGLQPVFHFSVTSSEPVIEYHLVHHMLAQRDPAPLLRVYGNGRVHVHFPAYMKLAGDYELYMNTVELNELLRQLADNGIMDFDPATAKQEIRQLEAARRAASSELFYISDATDTVIKVRLDQYQRSPSSQRIKAFNKQFRWRNLEVDARRYTASGAITRAASAAATLHAMCLHPGLQKLP